MKRYFIFILLSILNLPCFAITKSEFQDFIGEQTQFLSLLGYMELNKDGTGIYSSDMMVGLGGMYEYISLFSGTVQIDCDGAVAICRYRCPIKLKWQIVKGNVVIRYTNIIGQTQAEIVSWETRPYASSTIDCVKQKLRQKLADDKGWVGKSITYAVVKNTEGKIGLQINEEGLDKFTATASTFWAYNNTPDQSSSQSSSTSSDVREYNYEPQYTDVSYPYGDDGINNYVTKYIKYPSSIQRDGFKGTAYFTLEINSDGEVTDVTSSGSSNNSINVEIIEQTKKLLKRLPYPFTPATQDGKNVASSYQIGINYDLSPALIFDKTSISFPSSQKEERIKVKARKDWSFNQPQNSSLSARREGNYLVVSCQRRSVRDYDAINDKIIVSTTDNSASYTINISQEGSPRPFIKVEKVKVIIPSDGTPQTISVYSNRIWSVVNPDADSKFTINSSTSSLTIGAKKNLSRKGRTVSYTIKTADGEVTVILEVYQNSRADE